MEKGFNDLFDDFFKNNNPNDKHLRIRDEAKKMIEMMMRMETPTPPENMVKALDDNLGDPDEIESGFDGVLYFERRIWHTPHGDIVKVLVTDDLNKLNHKPEQPKIVEKSLEAQLQDAVESEDYERAALLRDKLTPQEQVVKTPKRKRAIKKPD